MQRQRYQKLIPIYGEDEAVEPSAEERQRLAAEFNAEMLALGSREEAVAEAEFVFFCVPSPFLFYFPK